MPTLTVPADAGSLRIDAFLARHVPGGSRRAAQRALAEGAVRVNGRRVRKRQIVGPGDVIDVPDAFVAPPGLRPNAALVVPVLYEDAAVLALEKPAGMPSHALRPEETGTVANFLLAHFPETASVGAGPLEPGIVHRLDTETSGVLLVARTAAAYAALRQQFAAHRVRKEYVVVVEGTVVAAGAIRTPLAHAAHNRRKMRVAAPEAPGARPADTRYRPLADGNGRTLLAVRIRTGVMHQIRAHLASIGHPVVGDVLYGGSRGGAEAARHLLHAVSLRFEHPETGALLTVVSPMPDELAAAVGGIQSQVPSPRSQV